MLADDVAAEPLRERRWATLALARYRSGNQVAALRTVADAPPELVESVGVEPGRELQALEQQLLAQDPELDWRPAPAVPSGHLGAGPVVVGREAEVHDVIDLLDRHRIVVLEGPSGIGQDDRGRRGVPARGSPVGVGRRSPRSTRAGQRCRAIAAALELPDRAADTTASTSVARHLHRSAALLVLDGFGDSGPIVRRPVTALVSRAPDAAGAVTSRAAAPHPPRDPAPAGPARHRRARRPRARRRCSPPTSRPSRAPQSRDRWATIEALCRRSGGVPLALRLLAARRRDGVSCPRADGPGVDLVGDAARAALGRLPPRRGRPGHDPRRPPGPVTVPLARPGPHRHGAGAAAQPRAPPSGRAW